MPLYDEGKLQWKTFWLKDSGDEVIDDEHIYSVDRVNKIYIRNSAVLYQEFKKI